MSMTRGAMSGNSAASRADGSQAVSIPVSPAAHYDRVAAARMCQTAGELHQVPLQPCCAVVGVNVEAERTKTGDSGLTTRLPNAITRRS